MRFLTGKARLAGVIGWPVGHSRSPRLHGFWIERHQLDAAYVPLAVHPADLRVALSGLRAAGFAGANVTIPHKEAAIEICDRVEPFARKAGAVNTIVFESDRIVGRNTDGFGFLANLRSHRVDPAAGKALILGAGGGSRAIAAALQEAGASVLIANRTRARAEALADELGDITVVAWDDVAAALADVALLVNATSLGMTGQAPLDIDLGRAAPGLAVADIVYAPLETKLLAAARAAGLRAVEGLGMLLHQARPGFAAWFGVEPEVDAALYDVVAADLKTADLKMG
jgi:shikimate dehydrogenase